MLIGFAGTQRSGKTAAANHLVQQHGFTRHGFADPLKAMLLTLPGIKRAHLYGGWKHHRLDVLCGKTAREAMQLLGYDFGRRMIGQDIWIKAWIGTRPEGPVVIDDVRFANEADMIRNLGGIVVRIKRPSLSNDDGHASEKLRFEADFVLINQQSLDHLRQSVDSLLVSVFPMSARCEEVA